MVCDKTANFIMCYFSLHPMRLMLLSSQYSVETCKSWPIISEARDSWKGPDAEKGNLQIISARVMSLKWTT